MPPRKTFCILRGEWVLWIAKVKFTKNRNDTDKQTNECIREMAKGLLRSEGFECNKLRDQRDTRREIEQALFGWSSRFPLNEPPRGWRGRWCNRATAGVNLGKCLSFSTTELTTTSKMTNWPSDLSTLSHSPPFLSQYPIFYAPVPFFRSQSGRNCSFLTLIECFYTMCSQIVWIVNV